jgi:hypothetical protein
MHNKIAPMGRSALAQKDGDYMLSKYSKFTHESRRMHTANCSFCNLQDAYLFATRIDFDGSPKNWWVNVRKDV